MEFLEGIKGIGLWERVGVIVYFNHREWKEAASGMVPETIWSGNFIGIHFRIGCIKWARSLFTQIAYTTLSHQPWARLHYNRKRKEALSCSEVFRYHMVKDFIHTLEEGRDTTMKNTTLQ